MKKCLLITLSTIVVFIGQMRAQVGYVTINGNVDSLFIKQYATHEIILTKKIATNFYDTGTSIKVPLSKEGYFTAKIATDDSLFYLALEFEDNKSEQWKGDIYNAYGLGGPHLDPVYLFQVGDSVSVNITRNWGASFTGRGSEKLNCQEDIRQIESVHAGFRRLRSAYDNNKDIKSLVQLYQSAIKFSTNMRLTVLNGYQKSLTGPIFRQLKADALCYNQYTLVAAIELDLHNVKDKSIATEWLLKNVLSGIDSLIRSFDSSSLIQSAYAADMIFEKDRLTSLIMNKRNPLSIEKQVECTYTDIKRRYTGILRDRLLYIFYEVLSYDYADECKRYIDDAISMSESPRYIQALQNWKKKQLAAFPFEFYDAENRVHKLSDYKGKLLIIDFWFTGCGPCRELSMAMHEIFEKYKHSKEVVFLTVSTDPKAIWLRSVASGKYTSDGMINLHTNGKGFEDPLIKHYNFKGFPRQLIIDRNGDLISSTPPRPDIGEANKQAFLQLIEQGLRAPYISYLSK